MIKTKEKHLGGCYLNNTMAVVSFLNTFPLICSLKGHTHFLFPYVCMPLFMCIQNVSTCPLKNRKSVFLCDT